jgi:CRISPR system Cascade subunit CasA
MFLGATFFFEAQGQPDVTEPTLNLVTDAWLPVKRASGRRDVIRPAQIVEGIAEGDPVVSPDWPRADFRIATLEFLIGLLSTAAPPKDHSDWCDGWHEPPTPALLDGAFAPIAHAFSLDGPGPRFLQDFEDLSGEPEPVERLLIEAPGEATVRKNTSLLVKPNRFSALGRPAAAIALFTLQSWAPSGGAGNRTGLRGGGPLVTLVRPERASLWHLLWANTPCGAPPGMSELPRVFPWLAPTLVSTGGRPVTPDADAHPLQAFWGMPRRIRLEFEEHDGPNTCDLTGIRDSVRVIGWRQRPHGANYVGWGRRHPLSPHYQMKAGDEWLPVHPQPGGIGYRHWLGLVVASERGKPAACVTTWRTERRRDAREGPNTGLIAAGYDMDNMKARAFVETEMPLPGASIEDQNRIDRLAADLVRAADTAAGLLRSAVRNALFSPGASVKTDAEALSALRERLWAETESEFFAALREATATSGVEQGAEPERRAWAALLNRRAMALFDEAAPLDPEAGVGAARIAAARRGLAFALRGFGKQGAAFFAALSLPPPGTQKEAA